MRHGPCRALQGRGEGSEGVEGKATSEGVFVSFVTRAVLTEFAPAEGRVDDARAYIATAQHPSPRFSTPPLAPPAPRPPCAFAPPRPFARGGAAATGDPDCSLAAGALRA